MNKYFAAVAVSVAFTQPADAITFPSLTTIYVGSGVTDDSSAANLGVATSIHCSNVSGVTVQVRVLILGPTGAVAASATSNLAHGATRTFSSHPTDVFEDLGTPLATGIVTQGVVNIEATNSAVFCTAVVLDAEGIPDFMSPLHLVRVNPHPGTVE